MTFLSRLFGRRLRSNHNTNNRAVLSLDRLEERVVPATNILVSTDGSYPQQLFREYTPTGALVRSVVIPPGGTAEDARDLVADSAGNVLFFNGTFSPYLSTYNANNGVTSHVTAAGWSTVNNVSYGGIALYGNFAFVTDMATSGAGTAKGIVQFDRANGSSYRFANTVDFIDLNMGLDGKLYGLAGSTLYVYNPDTTTLERTVALPTSLGGVTPDYRAVAVNNAGEIYTATWDEKVHRFAGDGTHLASVTLTGPGGSFYDLVDIDASADGNLVVGARSGHVTQLTQSFTNITYFSAGTSPAFVAFGPDVPLAPPLPTLNIANTSVTEGNAGTTNAVFTVTLSAASSQPVTVNWATANGTATAGSDYIAASGTITFDPGQTSKTISVAVIGETVDENTESFYVNLSGATYATIADGQGLCWLYDDDDSPRIYVTDPTITEGNSGVSYVSFNVTLSQTWGQTITVQYATGNHTATAGSDYAATSGTLTFSPGQTSKTVAVAVYGDTAVESNEIFFFNLSNPVNAMLGDPWGLGTINNDDSSTPSLSINDVSINEGNSGTTFASFTVTLSAAASGTVSVNYNTSNGTATSGSDYGFTSGSLTFSPGQTSKTVSVPIYGDTAIESNETFTVTLSGASGATISDGSGAGTIVNDDYVQLFVGDTSVVEGDSGSQTATVTMSLSQASTQTVTVNYYYGNGPAMSGEDFTFTNGSLTFAPGQTSKTVTATIYGDLLDEPNETFSVNLTNPVNATIGDWQGLVTIVDNDTATINVTDFSTYEGNSGTTYAGFVVQLTNSSTQTITVSYATAAGSATAGVDYGNVSGTLTFAPGQNSKAILVPLYGDVLDESHETYTLTLSNATNALIGDGQGVGNIWDDDTALASISNAVVTEGNSGTVTLSFNVFLSLTTDRTVTLDWATADGTATAGVDYVAGGGSVTYSAGETSKWVSVTVNGDTDIEADETINISLSNIVSVLAGDTQGVGTIFDEDGNHAPVANLGASQIEVAEMALTSFYAGNSYDPDNDTPLTYTWDFGDGSGQQGGLSAGHNYADNGSYTVTLTVTDPDGAWSIDTLTAIVSNVAPLAGVVGPTTVVPGQDVTFYLEASDPSPADAAAGYSFTVDWGDGNQQTFSGPSAVGAGLPVHHTYAEMGNYQVRVWATDKDNATSSFAAQLDVSVADVALIDGTLYVGGTRADDAFYLRAVSGGILVENNGNNLGTYAPSGVSGGGNGGVVLYAQGGNDRVFLVPIMSGPNEWTFPYWAAIFGGAGNDDLDASFCTSVAMISGGEGDDIVVGGMANDVLIGGAGYDNVLGGPYESPGGDLMLSDQTVFDNDLSALISIATEWARTDANLTTRIGHLLGTLPGGYNGSTVLNAQTVLNDGIMDWMSEGGGTYGEDWFIRTTSGPVDGTIYEGPEDVITNL